MGFLVLFDKLQYNLFWFPFFCFNFLWCPKGEDVWCTYVVNQYENERTTTWKNPWNASPNARWVVQKGNICIKPQFHIVLLHLKGKCYLLGTPLANNELLHNRCHPISNKASCRTLFLLETLNSKLIKTLRPCCTKSHGNKNFQCHYHVATFTPYNC